MKSNYNPFSNVSDERLDSFVDNLLHLKGSVHPIEVNYTVRLKSFHKELNNQLIEAEEERIRRGKQPISKIARLKANESGRT